MTELYAWVVKEADGREGIIAAAVFGSAPSQLVSCFKHVAAQLRPFAEIHAEGTGKPVRLVRFVEAETVETI